MAITIERLDHEDIGKDITLIIGKDVLFKLYPRKSIIDSDQELKRFVKTKDLCKSDKFVKIKKLCQLSEKRHDIIEDFYEMRKRAEDFLRDASNEDIERRRQVVMNVDGERLSKYKENLKAVSGEIKTILDAFGKTLYEDKKICFCSGCGSIISDKAIQSNQTCSICGRIVTRTSNSSCPSLKKDIKEYLEGHWFADYIAKGFRDRGWKAWTNLHILGASGINHEIDILAIHNKKGLSVIGECKTGSIGRKDIFTFSIKGQDIGSTYAYFFNTEDLPEKDTRKFMDRKGILYVDKLKEKTEDDLFNEIFKNLD